MEAQGFGIASEVEDEVCLEEWMKGPERPR